MHVPLDQWRDLPDLPGVYFFYGPSEELLYVGKSVRVRQRVRSYLRKDGGHSTQTERLKFEARTVAVQTTGSELSALLLENRLIKELLPPFNQAQRRYRHYPFIRLDIQDAFPRLEVTRDLVDDGAEYFGPYREYRMLYGLIRQISGLLGLRTCQGFEEIQRGCLLDQMDRCSAPCRGWVTTADYQIQIAEVRHLLMGEGGKGLLEQVKARMTQAALAEAFEQAARWRDRYRTLEKFVKHQSWRKNQVILDVCAVYPTAVPQQAEVFWIRGGRLAQIQKFSATHGLAQAVKEELIHYQTPSTPLFRLPQAQLDEFHLLATWLYRNHKAPAVVWLANGDPEDLGAQICTRIQEVISSSDR